ncbi:MAG: hypothetical protein ACYS5W_15500, partial [Planctomycetota bacterium]
MLLSARLISRGARRVCRVLLGRLLFFPRLFFCYLFFCGLFFWWVEDVVGGEALGPDVGQRDRATQRLLLCLQIALLHDLEHRGERTDEA